MLETEARNPQSMHLQSMTNVEIAALMNQKNNDIQAAIARTYENISLTVDACVNSLKSGGRIIYIGAGTSGRLGVLDAAECVPTFNAEPNQVVGILAGGHDAMFQAAEGAEDNVSLGKHDLIKLHTDSKDTVIGIAASGRTPYVIGALNYANEVGATTVAIANNFGSKIGAIAKISIEASTGPEILTGSTRLASGTVQKEILNTISTIAMIRFGKVYSNLMIDVKPSNEKLERRARAIIKEITDATAEEIERALLDSGHHVGIAIVMLRNSISADEASKLLQTHTVAELI
ncbi:N-acetylmuramic acid 6-phosphate etherase [Lacticaseibacillus daqingensis]|uniref:N-acetylmuramic acid 6-phosphate etherase n=1 Tax=Lacticaseibacillus daqingensis TaxID=2486014 RepID=UPI000F7BA468|nr:N-acetylmuramic acid 6-phosphate etherase [Lacticaseibacillus daqingensis]